MTSGKREGVIVGMESIFTSQNVSFVARATKASRYYSQWVPINEKVRIPFKRNQIVTLNRSTENIWALTPEKIAEEVIEEEYKINGDSIIFRGALNYGLNQTVSGVEAEAVKRSGTSVDLLYQWPWKKEFGVSLGGRLQQDSTVTENGTFTTNRMIFLAEMTLYFLRLREMSDSQVYVGVGFGFGYSQTTIDDYSQSGNVRMLPSLRMGISIPLLNRYDIIAEGGFENIYAGETNEEGTTQNINETNIKAALGLRMSI